MLNTIPKLSDRDKNLLSLKAEGLTNKEISTKVHLSKKRVDNILHDLRKKYKCENSFQLVAMALREEWID